MKSWIALALVPALSGAAAAQSVGVGTMSQGTLGYSAGAAIAKLLTEVARLEARVQPHGGTSAYLPLVNTGELDFGLANILETIEAVGGEGAFGGRKQSNLRAVSAIFPFSVGVFVKKDSNIKAIADLKGRSVGYGFTAQVTIRTILDAILINGGLQATDVKQVLVPTIVRGADEFAAGKADAAFFALGAGKVAEVDAGVGGIRYLPMVDTPAAVAAMKGVFSFAYLTEVEPAPALPGVLAKIKVMAYDYMFLTGAHVKDDVVYRAVKAVAENQVRLAATHASFRQFSPDAMAKDLPVAYHPGAIRWYREINQWPPKG
ncbi:MAG: TAXI family TRAP transporter solute-binding subunit [Pseudomonadota bacterium]